MKTSHVISFLVGVAAMIGFSSLRGSNAEPSHHVYELRLYHVNAGKMEMLSARFRDHTDAIFKRHNMESVGYWVPEDPPSSQNLFVYILQHPSRQEAEKIHFTGSGWKRLEVEPPGGDLGHYDVVDRQIRQNSVRITYKMTKEKANGAIIAFYTCAFDIDPSTYAMRNIKKQNISRDTFVALRR
jgi:NIPSNAP